MRYLAWVFAGLLLAAAVHVATMPRAERAAILRISPAPVDAQAAAVGTGSSAAQVPGIDAPGPGAVDDEAAWPTGTGAAPPAPVPGTAASRPPAATPATGSARPPATATVRPPAPLPSGLVVPVRGVAPSQLSPTFTDARGEDRVHEALDIMAPAGTPVLAVADGHVEKLFDSDQGGLTIYQFDPAGRHAYYYAHLERYAAGLAEGQDVRQGQVIGYVGSSGNADPAAPHLHFAIFVLGPEKQWWKGTPIDPYPLLAAPR